MSLLGLIRFIKKIKIKKGNTGWANNFLFRQDTSIHRVTCLLKPTIDRKKK